MSHRSSPSTSSPTSKPQRLSSKPSTSPRTSPRSTTPSRTTSPSELLDAALAYAGRGWPVLPLVAREKRPANTNGLLGASTDTEVIAAWWDRWPEANIGLRTGSKFDVLDLDGPTALKSLERIAPGYKHPGPVGGTGKGHHLLFGVTNAKNGANLGSEAEPSKIDFRGQNGYIVAPPSIHPNGHSYRWLRPITLPLPDAPYWLLELVFPRPPESDRPARDLTPGVAAMMDRLDLETELGKLGVQFRQRGPLREGKCPFHDDSTPSLKIYPNETFYCFGCGAWGDALNVLYFAAEGRLR